MYPRLKKLKAIMELEIDTHYSFPLLETIVSLLVIMSFYYATKAGFFMYGEIPIEYPIPGQSLLDLLPKWIEMGASVLAGRVYDNMMVILAFFVPVLTALSFGRDMDAGAFKTLLSYPISRRQLFMSKELLVLATTCGISSVSVLVAIRTFEPGPVHMDIVLMGTAVLWIPAMIVSSITALIAIHSRSLSASLFGGIAVSVGRVLSPFLFKDMPDMLIAIMNPGYAINTYLSSIQSGEILYSIPVGMFIAFAIGVLLLIVSMVSFDRMEV